MYLPIAQFVASVALAFASLTVAFVSVLFSYRNNFGWPPIIIVSGDRFDLLPPSDEFELFSIHVEVWNRRKYPIALRSVVIRFSDIELVHDQSIHTTEQLLIGTDQTSLWSFEHHTVAPSSSLQLAAKVLFKKVDVPSIEVRISAKFYDPRSNDDGRIATKYTVVLHDKVARPRAIQPPPPGSP